MAETCSRCGATEGLTHYYSCPGRVVCRCGHTWQVGEISVLTEAEARAKRPWLYEADDDPTGT